MTLSEDRIAIIAGYGLLPIHVAKAIKQNGQNPFIIPLHHEADQDWQDFDHKAMNIADLATFSSILKQNKIHRIVLAGGIRRRPAIASIKPTFASIYSLFPVIKTLLSGGDDALLKSVIRLIEAEGCQVIGAHEVVPNLLAELGSLGQQTIGKTAALDIKQASRAALKLGELDVGQGAISVRGRIVALEGLEGTDEMLNRVAQLRQSGRLRQGDKKGVLVKLCKPNQDMRADLPSIGPATVENAHKAGLEGIAVEAGRALVLDREKLIETADKLGLFVTGISIDNIQKNGME